MKIDDERYVDVVKMVQCRYDDPKRMRRVKRETPTANYVMLCIYTLPLLCAVALCYCITLEPKRLWNPAWKWDDVCHQLHENGGNEATGFVLRQDTAWWDIVLLLALQLHRDRLIRRGEWFDTSGSADSGLMNSDLYHLLDRPFKLLPNRCFMTAFVQTPFVNCVAKPFQAKVQGLLSEEMLEKLSKHVYWHIVMLLSCVFTAIGGWLLGSVAPLTLNVGLGLIVLGLVLGLVGLVWFVNDYDVSKDTDSKQPSDGRDSDVDAGEHDNYVATLCWELVALPLVVWFYFQKTGQSASTLSASVTQSALPMSIVALGCGVFVLILIDRMVYVHESRVCKLVLLWGSVVAFCVFWILNPSPPEVDTETSSFRSQSWPLMIACSLYFYQSAKQLETKMTRKPGRRYTQDQKTWVHTLRWLIRGIPFLMELVYLIDWLCTQTALSLRQYIQVEEIYTVIFEQLAVHKYETARKDKQAAPKEWKASMSNGKCLPGCGLIGLVVVLWGPLFIFSTSDIFGSRTANLVHGVSLQFEVRVLTGKCERDASGVLSAGAASSAWCTVDTYTLWASTSAEIRSITSANDLFGPFLSTQRKQQECPDSANCGTSQMLDHLFRPDQAQLVRIDKESSNAGWRVTSKARLGFEEALGHRDCKDEHPEPECTSLSSRMTYTFSRLGLAQEDISGATAWQPLENGQRNQLHTMISAINHGSAHATLPVNNIVQYPLYLRLPLKGAAVGNQTVKVNDLMIGVDLGYTQSGVDDICQHPNHMEGACVAEQTWRNTSMGADLSWFTVDGAARPNDPLDTPTSDVHDCREGTNDHFSGLCFILLNERTSGSDAGKLLDLRYLAFSANLQSSSFMLTLLY